jgi:hypothetical protein
MWIVSGAIHDPVIHFEAPPSRQAPREIFSEAMISFRKETGFSTVMAGLGIGPNRGKKPDNIDGCLHAKETRFLNVSRKIRVSA